MKDSKKFWIAVVTFILTIVGAILLDGMFVDWIVGLFPASAVDWLGVIRFGAWIVVLWLTLAVSILLAYGLSTLIFLLL